MPSYKLYYFKARGRAEICRLAFAAAKIGFEDCRLDFEEWTKFKQCELNLLFCLNYLEICAPTAVSSSITSRSILVVVQRFLKTAVS